MLIGDVRSLTGLLLVSSVEFTDTRSSSTVDSSKYPPVCDEQTLSLSRGKDAYNIQTVQC